MGAIFLCLGVAILAAMFLSWLWPKVKGFLPAKVQNVGNQIENKVDQAQASGGLILAIQLFNERKDSESSKVLGECLAKVWTWIPEAVEVKQ